MSKLQNNMEIRTLPRQARLTQDRTKVGGGVVFLKFHKWRRTLFKFSFKFLFFIFVK